MTRGSISEAIYRRGHLAILLVSGLLCGKLEARPAQGPGGLTWGNTEFAFNLLKQLVQEQPGSNIFISPYSASTALQMVCAGAEGVTRTEMQETLGTSDMQPIDLYEANRSLYDFINAENTNFVLTTANSIWFLTGFPIEKSFLLCNRNYFGATFEALNFFRPASARIINSWASNATEGKIDKIVSWPMDPNLRLLLANAVYFHGTWQNQFDTNYTTNRTFYLEGGGQKLVPMMEQSTNFCYCESNGFQAVELPYRGSNLAMYVFLPTTGTMENLLGSMGGQWWQQTAANAFSNHMGTVTFPKFNLSYDVVLNEPLEALGMESAFSDGADFSGISREPLHISQVKQQAVVEVNEEGTVATAVTTISVVTSVAGGDEPFQMIVNRPFLFFIVDKPAATVLFMGAVVDP